MTTARKKSGKALREQNSDPPDVANAPQSPAPAEADQTQTASRLRSSEPDKAPVTTLYDFVKKGWEVLEPVAKFQENWHLELICEYLTLIRDGNFKDKFPQQCEGIIFNVPPRTMKSLLITVFFPVWVWITHPERRFMFVSYSEKLSTQHSIYRRAVMESDWFRKNWLNAFTISKDQNVKHHYENSHRGAMFSTGMQSTATGMGGDILIFDDPLNPEQAMSEPEREAVNLRFDSTFRSRINDPKTGVKIVIMQRLHELDLTGHILSKERNRWKHVSLPAIAEEVHNVDAPDGTVRKHRPVGDFLWPDRLSPEFLAGQKIGMGSWAFAGQYQQNPAPLEGGIIRRSWIQLYRELPPKFDFMVQSWDCTFTGSDRSDYVAGQVWGRVGSRFYMLPYRLYERLDFAPTRAAIKSCHALYPRANAILIEDKANGPAIISELQKEISGVVPVSPDGGKMSRAQAMAPLWEAGSVHLPDPQVFDVSWLEEYIHNICTFPKAAHDDDMDATSQAFIYMRNKVADGVREFYRRQAGAPN